MSKALTAKPEPVKIEVLAKDGAAVPKEKPAKKKEAGAVIRSCICDSKFQDGRYGKGRRVFTCAPKKTTCTVCGRAA